MHIAHSTLFCFMYSQQLILYKLSKPPRLTVLDPTCFGKVAIFLWFNCNFSLAVKICCWQFCVVNFVSFLQINYCPFPIIVLFLVTNLGLHSFSTTFFCLVLNNHFLQFYFCGRVLLLSCTFAYTFYCYWFLTISPKYTISINATTSIIT